MLGIGLPEFLVILAVAVIVIGPKDLPRALYAAGKMARNIKKMASGVQATFEDVMREGELQDIIEEANKPGGDTLQQQVEAQVLAEKENKKNEPSA